MAGFVTCAKLDTDLSGKQDKLNGCDGQPLPEDATVPTCAELDDAIEAVETVLATKQGQLKNCAGTNHAANANVPSCAEMTAAITAAATPDATETVKGKVELATPAETATGTDSTRAVTPAGLKPLLDAKQAALTNCAGSALSGSVPTCAEMNTAIGDAIDAVLAPSAEFEAAVKESETVTTLKLDATSGNYVYESEDGTETVIEPGNFLSSDAGQSLSLGSDDKLFVNVIAMLPEDVQLSGSTNGNVDVTFVPDITDPNMVTIEANLDVANKTPTNGTNLLKEGASGFFVSGDEIETDLDLVDRFAAKQGQLRNCAGANIAANAQVPLCSEMSVAISTAIATIDGSETKVEAGTNVTVTGTGTAADPYVVNATGVSPLATTTVAGLIEEATGEETRLGATDANKDDRAVTPGSMSYTLQTLKDYPIKIRAAAGWAGIFFSDEVNDGSSGSLLGSAMSGTASTNLINNPAVGVKGQIVGVATPSGTTSVGVHGLHVGAGAGQKIGVFGDVNAGGGTCIGVYGRAVAGATNWAGYLEGNVTAGPITTLSDATLKEDVQAIDPAKALQFRNGLRWVSYEMFTEQQEQINDEEGNPTGRYEVKRQSLGHKYGLIAQDVQALTKTIGAFGDVVAVVGEYFTLDEQGYPIKDAEGSNIVNKRFGLDYDAINVIILAAEQHDSSVSRRQAFLALNKLGLLATVEAAVAKADKTTQIEWETAQSFNRNYGTVIELAKNLGISDKQLDELFAYARTV